MAIVARGLGQPEDGAIVVGGMGAVEVDPNAMSATLTGTLTIVATLAAADTNPPEPPTGGGNTSPGLSFPAPRKKPTPGLMSAVLTGSGSLMATIDYSINFDAELEELLLVGAI